MGSSPLKYADKSAGQPELVVLFTALKNILLAYARGSFNVKTDRPGAFEVFYGREVEQKGKKYPELCFAGLLIQKGYVGFYFFPVYVDPEILKKLNPALRKSLKGKTCFHLKNNGPEILQHVREALQTGYQYYTSRGWK